MSAIEPGESAGVSAASDGGCGSTCSGSACISSSS
ncbi:hypothetical protein ACWGII_34120 [Streptomyces sp. NPDC054855]